MTDNQRKNLQTMANAISAGRASVSESFAAGQLQLITQRPWDKSLDGIAMMQAENMLPENFIRPETVGLIAALVSRNACVAELFTRFEIILSKGEPVEFQGFKPPNRSTVEELKTKFSLPEF